MSEQVTAGVIEGNGIDRVFASCRREGRAAFMPFLTAGDPSLEQTERLLDVLAGSGADLIELGLPFSDPLADGPVIQKANERALAGGFRTDQLFDLARRWTRRSQVPLVMLTYYNPIFRRGPERFVEAATAAGFQGFIVPDLSHEESAELAGICRRHGAHLIPFAAPTSGADRLQRVTAGQGGFVYCVSLTGVTGARKELSDRVADMMVRIRPHTQRPLAVGFGISTPEHARTVARLAEGVIVGSALVRLIEEYGPGDALEQELGQRAEALAAAVRSVRKPIDGAQIT